MLAHASKTMRKQRKKQREIVKKLLTNGRDQGMIVDVAALEARWRKASGSIAQLGEHLPYKQRVTGSSPVVPTKLAR